MRPMVTLLQMSNPSLPTGISLTPCVRQYQPAAVMLAIHGQYFGRRYRHAEGRLKLDSGLVGVPLHLGANFLKSTWLRLQQVAGASLGTLWPTTSTNKRIKYLI